MNPLRTIFVQISRIPPVLMLIVVVALAGVVALLVSDTLNKQKQSSDALLHAAQEASNRQVTVVYALKDIPEGQPIPSDALEERKLAESKAPPDAIPSATLAAGHVAKYGLAANSLVSQHDLAPQNMTVGFESRLKEGMRAVTFGVDNNSGVAGFVQPESRVDIMAMVGSGNETKAAPILSDVQIIAVGQQFQKTQNGTVSPSSSVTVAVSPEDTQKLIKGVCASKLYLALRNDKDHTPVATIDVNSMFGKPQSSKLADISMLPPPQIPGPGPTTDLGIMSSAQAQAIAPPPKSLHEVEVWSASKKDLLAFPQ